MLRQAFGALATAAAFALLASAPAKAADSVTVTVNATVTGVCKFNSGQTPVVTVQTSGGVIDPSAAGPATGNTSVLYRCTNGTSPTFTVPATATVTCTTSGSCGSSAMTTTMTSAGGGAGSGMGSGQDKTLTVTGTLPASQYANSPAGDYSGTITVSVTP
jgi:hypothetical protein